MGCLHSSGTGAWKESIQELRSQQPRVHLHEHRVLEVKGRDGVKETQGTKAVCYRMDQESTNSGAADTHGESLVLPSAAVPRLSSHIWPICFL